MLINQLQQIQCQKWAKEGQAFSEELYDSNIEIYDRLKDRYTYFAIANGIALTWTKHALYDANFVEIVASFFDGKRSLVAKDVDPYKHRFGLDSLYLAILGLKEFVVEIKSEIPDFSTCTAKEMKKFQDRSFNRLCILKKDNRANGVGPWLFLGPMKIILGLEKRLWKNTEIDAIILPSGIEVNRGVKKIIKMGYPVTKTFDENFLVNEEKTLEEGYTIDTLIQNLLSEIAKIGKTRIIHINSAFYLYGSQ